MIPCRQRNQRFLRAFHCPLMMFLLSVAGAVSLQAQPPADSYQPHPIARIPAGTVIGKQVPAGWSHIVMLAKPRLASGDIDDVPKIAAKCASMLNFAILARVGGEPGNYQLEKIAIGYTVDINGRQTVITSKTQEALGAKLGFIEKQVLAESEVCLDDVKQVFAYPTMFVFDAQATMLRNGEHREMVMRHLVWAGAQDGRLGTAVWLLEEAGQGYRMPDGTIQLLPANYQEDRILNVKKDRFVLGIPKRDAFALTRVPPGRPVNVTPALARLAAVPRFDNRAAFSLAQDLNSAIRQLPKP